jgi:hypothetical protein
MPMTNCTYLTTCGELLLGFVCWSLPFAPLNLMITVRREWIMTDYQFKPLSQLSCVKHTCRYIFYRESEC